MSQKKKLTPAQREKKQLAAARRQKEKKQALLKKAIIAGAVLVAVILCAVVLITALRDENSHTTSNQGGTAAPQTTAPAQTVAGDGATLDTAVATHIAKIEIKDYGIITLELYGNTAPVTVANFVSLAQSGFYEGLTFHRIIEGFMMQAGAPKADGQKAASIVGEFSANGYVNNLLHKKGVISMARSSVMDSASSQFFIMHEDYPSLDGKYAAFGMVIDGIEIVDAICTDAKPTDGNGSIAESAQPVILSVTVTGA